MKRSTPTPIRMLAVVAILAMVAVACGDGDGTQPAPTGTAGDGTGQAGPSGSLSMHSAEPENLVTTNNTESEGNEVLEMLYTNLIEYDPETTEPIPAVAESVESDDGGQTWNITLNEGWTFHNGEEVTAESFVRAWNYAAYGPNAQQTSGFFAPIEGYDALQCGTVTETNEEGEEEEVADCENQPPSAEELSGLTVEDDLNFTVTLAEAESFFEIRLGYAAYSPLPEAFYDDPEGFNEEPIGNGPYMMDGPWEHNTGINLTANPDYPGEDAPTFESIEVRIYDDVNTALNDLLAGNLDVVHDVPPDRATEIRDSAPNFDSSPQSAYLYLGMPLYDPNLGGDENAQLRAALSMAVDREALSETIFSGTRQPANSILPPVIPGHQPEVCDNWNYDPEAAQQAFDEAGGWEGTMTVWFNSGAGHDAWVEAVTNMWRETLGIQDFEFQTLQFAEYLPLLDERGVNGPFRLGWSMDYPHPQNFLQLLLDPDFAPPVGANTTFYESEEFDQALDAALAETELDAAIPHYQEAERIACEDTVHIPIAFYENLYAWSDNVEGAYVDAFGNLVVSQMSATS